ncbi:glycoside hydrolase family 2 TIM barrel-domain containing protein [Corallococcus sp. M7]
MVALLLPAWAAEARTSILKAGEGWQLKVDGQPYVAKGVTFSGTGGPANFDKDCEQLKSLGVNTLRTWGTGDETAALLDAAQKHGLRVLVGLWLRPGRPGMENDDAFDYVRDARGREAQLQATVAQVLRFKDHPAVLAWGVGNEVILNSPDEPSKVAYARFLEKVVRAVKKADPAHPVLSVDAWTLGIPFWEKYVPSLDAYGLNVYGRGIHALADAVKQAGGRKPWFITEFGAQGEWEAPKDARGVPQEPGDGEKYDVIVDGWRNALAPHVQAGRCLGLFVFNYSAALDHGGLWLGMLSGTSTRPAWHAVREAYTGVKPSPALPVLVRLEVRGLEEGWANVAFDVTSTTPVEVSFAYNFRGAATRAERDRVTMLESRKGTTPGTWRVRLPVVTGAIKLYGLAKDGAGNLVAATTSVVAPAAP